jgi:hypothetical protein
MCLLVLLVEPVRTILLLSFVSYSVHRLRFILQFLPHWAPRNALQHFFFSRSFCGLCNLADSFIKKFQYQVSL